MLCCRAMKKSYFLAFAVFAVPVEILLFKPILSYLCGNFEGAQSEYAAAYHADVVAIGMLIVAVTIPVVSLIISMIRREELWAVSAIILVASGLLLGLSFL